MGEYRSNQQAFKEFVASQKGLSDAKLVLRQVDIQENTPDPEMMKLGTILAGTPRDQLPSVINQISQGIPSTEIVLQPDVVSNPQ